MLEEGEEPPCPWGLFFLVRARSSLISEVAPPSVGLAADKGERGDLLSAPWRPLVARCSVPREE